MPVAVIAGRVFIASYHTTTISVRAMHHVATMYYRRADWIKPQDRSCCMLLMLHSRTTVSRVAPRWESMMVKLIDRPVGGGGTASYRPPEAVARVSPHAGDVS